MFGRVYLGFLGLEVKSEETNLTVLEGRFGVSLMEVIWFVVFWFVVWWLVRARNGIRE